MPNVRQQQVECCCTHRDKPQIVGDLSTGGAIVKRHIHRVLTLKKVESVKSQSHSNGQIKSRAHLGMLERRRNEMMSETGPETRLQDLRFKDTTSERGFLMTSAKAAWHD